MKWQGISEKKVTMMKITNPITTTRMLITLFLLLQIQVYAQFADNNPPVLSHQPKRWGEWGEKNSIDAIIGDNSSLASVEITFQYQNSKATGTLPVDQRWDHVPAVVKVLGQTALYSKPNEQSTIRTYVDPSISLQVLRITGPFYLVISSNRKAGFVLASQTVTVLSGKAYRMILPANFCKKPEIKYQIHASDIHGNKMDSDVYTLSFKTRDEIVALMQGKKPPKKKSVGRNTDSYYGNQNSFGGLALVFNAGTSGGSAGLAKSLNDKLNIRTSYNYYKYKHNGILKDIDPVDLVYNVDLKLTSISGLLDYYPFGGSFHLTGGLYYNKNMIKGLGSAADSVEVNAENTYTPEEIGELEVHLKPNTVWTPYLGIGFGNPLALGHKVGFFMDLGVIYQGSPKVDFFADENDIIYPTVEEDKTVEENMKMYKWYPVVQLGLSIQL